MPAPVVPIQVLQYGPEATAGTLVPAVRVVDHTPGSAQLKRDISMIKVRNAGSFATGHRNYVGQEGVTIEYSAPATYNRLTDVGNQFINTVATGTGTGATRTWTFTPSDTADLLKRFSYELGGTNFPSAYTVSGVVGQSLDISIKPNEPWMLKETLVGMVTTAGSITGALSLPSSLPGDDVLWTQTLAYFDATTFGSTVQAGRVVSADVSLVNGVEPRHTLEGLTTPYRVALAKERSISATIVVEYDSQTQYTAWAAGTVQKVRLKATGTASRAATLDINGFWESLELGNDNGVITTQLKLTGEYDPTGLVADYQLVVVNGVTTLATLP